MGCVLGKYGVDVAFVTGETTMSVIGSYMPSRAIPVPVSYLVEAHHQKV